MKKELNRAKIRVKSGQHPRLNYLQTVGEMFGSVDDSEICPFIVLKTGNSNNQAAMKALLEKE